VRPCASSNREIPSRGGNRGNPDSPLYGRDSGVAVNPCDGHKTPGAKVKHVNADAFPGGSIPSNSFQFNKPCVSVVDQLQGVAVLPFACLGMDPNRRF